MTEGTESRRHDRVNMEKVKIQLLFIILHRILQRARQMSLFEKSSRSI